MISKLRQLLAPPPIAAPPTAEIRTVMLAGQLVSYKLKRTRRRSIGLRIDDRGLVVNIPTRTSEKWLSSILQDKALWVVDKLAQWQIKHSAAPTLQDGQALYFMGETLTLRLVPSLFDTFPQRRAAELFVYVTGASSTNIHLESVDNHVTSANRGNRDAVQGARDAVWSFQTRSEQRCNAPDSPVSGGLPPDGVTTALSGLHSSPSGEQRISPDNCQQTLAESAINNWYKLMAEQHFSGRVALYAPLMRVSPNAIKLTSARTQWGSCTTQGTLRFNWQLIKMPRRLIDYVVIHELAHLIEMNHSPAFWREVEKFCPDYLMHRKELRLYQATLR